MPLFELLRAHVMAAERLHRDDTTVPVLARGKTDIAQSWVPVLRIGFATTGRLVARRRRGGVPLLARPTGPGRGSEHPRRHLASYGGVLQADAYGGYGKPYEPGPRAGSDRGDRLLVACAPKQLFVLLDIAGAARHCARGKGDVVLSPLCQVTVRRIDALVEHRARDQRVVR